MGNNCGNLHGSKNDAILFYNYVYHLHENTSNSENWLKPYIFLDSNVAVENVKKVINDNDDYDKILIYYSGHGYSNGNLNIYNSRHGLVRDRDLFQEINSVLKHDIELYIILDSCYSGCINTIPFDKIKKINLIASSCCNQLSSESLTSFSNLPFNINYYYEALSQIINNSSNNIKHAIVFCDTWKNINNSQLLPKLKNILNNLGVNYINGDKLIKSPLEIINIFLFAKFSIVSNSTLSWWGAYLSEGYVFSPVMNLWEPNLKIPDHWKQIYTNEISPKTHHNKLVFQPIIRNKQNANFRIYSYKRIIIIKVFRKISSKVNYFLKLKMFLKIIQYIGLLPENPNNTYN